MFWGLNPKTLEPFFDAFRIKQERENELRSSEIDISAWNIGVYIRDAIVSAFNKSAQYPKEPLSIQKNKTEAMTAKDHADNFREFLKHYKRAPVKGGEK